jgi:hypothetical protein
VWWYRLRTEEGRGEFFISTALQWFIWDAGNTVHHCSCKT